MDRATGSKVSREENEVTSEILAKRAPYVAARMGEGPYFALFWFNTTNNNNNTNSYYLLNAYFVRDLGRGLYMCYFISSS